MEHKQLEKRDKDLQSDQLKKITDMAKNKNTIQMRATNTKQKLMGGKFMDLFLACRIG